MFVLLYALFGTSSPIYLVCIAYLFSHFQDQEVLGYFEEHMLNMSLSQTPLRCIQVDLSTFGLDTYGLVYSMSNPLVESDINLLCLSTFRTANVLVRKTPLCLFCLPIVPKF